MTMAVRHCSNAQEIGWHVALPICLMVHRPATWSCGTYRLVSQPSQEHAYTDCRPGMDTKRPSTVRVPQRTARAHRAHRAHRALRQTRHLPVKCTPFSDRCFVKCYSKMFGSHCNVWFPMLCFQAVSKCLVSTAMFVSQCFVLKRSQNVWFPLQCLFPNALFSHC